MRHPLTPRLQTILELMADGRTNKVIAERLGLSTFTVNQHADTLYLRLGARNRAHAVTAGFREGVLR